MTMTTRSDAAEIVLDTTAETIDDAPDDKDTKGRGKAPLESVRPISELRTEEGQSIADWVRSVGSNQGPVQITVARREPKKHRGVKCDGQLMKFDELVDDIEERVREEQGGGTFLIGVKVPREKGAGWRFLTSRQIDIPGDPKVDHLRDLDPSTTAGAAAAAAAAAPAAADSKLADRVLTRAFDMIDSERKAPPAVAPVVTTSDPNMGRMIDGLNNTIRTLQAQLEARDAQISALLNKADKVDPFREKILENLMAGDNSRILAIRTAHESEISALRTAMIENEKRLRDQHDRDVARMEAAHVREIQSLTNAFTQSGSARDMSSSTQKLVLDGQIASLTREVTALRAENAELRAKKDKSPLEIAKELKSLKEALTDDDGDEDDKKESAIVQGLRVITESKLAAQAFKKLAGGEDETPKPPIGRPYRLGDGRIVITDAQGVTMPVPMRKRRPGPPQGAPAPATGTPQGAQNGQEAAPPPPNIAPASVEIAVQFLENAFRNNHDAGQVAESVRTMIPADVMGVLRDRGVDYFLDEVAKLQGNSSLASQKGRLFARKVGKALVDGAPQ
jgi:prefoldin subunit 5